MNKQLYSKKQFINMGVKYLSIIILLFVALPSCTKQEPLPRVDPRDAFVGRYEAIDSLFEFKGNSDTSGLPIYDFVSACRYPLVELRKADVFDYDWNRNEPGILYTVLEKDSLNFCSGIMGLDMEFLVSGSTEGAELIGTRETKFSTNRGAFRGNQLVFVNAVFYDYYSVTCLKRKD